MVSICPFMSKDVVDGSQPCAISCELRINNHCAFRVMAQKAIENTKPKEKEE